MTNWRDRTDGSTGTPLGSTTPIFAPITQWVPLGYSQITSLATAAGLASGSLGLIPKDACMVLIEAEAQAVRWRDDGVAPTASVGMPLAAGQEYQYAVKDLTKIQFIQQTASAILNLSFYK